MNGRILRVSLDSMPPYIDYEKTNDSVVVKGLIGDIWTNLEERLGFQCEYLIENYKAGISSLEGGSRDALLHPVVILANPTKHFALPVVDIWYSFYYKPSPCTTNSSNAFLKTWSLELWLSTISLVLFIIILLYAMLKISSKYSEKSEDDGETDLQGIVSRETDLLLGFSSYDGRSKDSTRTKKESHLKKRFIHGKTLANCFMIVIAGMLSQDIDIETNVVSVRIVIFVFLAFGIILDTAYSGLLISQLTLASELIPMTRVSEISKMNPDYSLCVRPETYPHFQLLTDKTNRDLWKTVLNKHPCPTKVRGFESVDLCHDSNVAYLEIPTLMEKHLNKAECSVTKLSKKYFPVAGSVLISRQLGIEVAKMFQEELMLFREMGLLSRLEKIWLTQRKDKKMPTWDGNHVQISYEHVAGVLILYIVAILFSCFVFCIEVSLPKRSSSFVSLEKKGQWWKGGGERTANACPSHLPNSLSSASYFSPRQEKANDENKWPN